MLPPVTHHLFIRYVQGRTTAAETAAVRAWLAQPAHQDQAQRWMHQHWIGLAENLLPPTANEPDVEAMLDRLHQHPAFDKERAPPFQSTTTWQRWAAAAGFVAAVGSAAWLLNGERPAAPVQVSTKYGQTQVLQLPDGSQVTLNGHSTLRYAPQWARDKPREVWLDGEGYFSVRHQANNQRFVVHTQAGFSVEVLGTKFTVNRRRDQARVVLLSGQVRVHFDAGQQPDVLMQPGELVETHDKQPAKLVHKVVRTAPHASWKDAQLVLDETSIAEVATRLQDTYGIEVVVESPELNNRKMTGTLPVRDLDMLVLALQEVFHLKAIRQGNRLTLSDPSPST